MIFWTPCSFFKMAFSVVSYHIIAWAYMSLVMNEGGRKRMTLAVTVALNMLTIPQNRPFWVSFYTKKHVKMQKRYKRTI